MDAVNPSERLRLYGALLREGMAVVAGEAGETPTALRWLAAVQLALHQPDDSRPIAMPAGSVGGVVARQCPGCGSNTIRRSTQSGALPWLCANCEDYRPDIINAS